MLEEIASSSGESEEEEDDEDEEQKKIEAMNKEAAKVGKHAALCFNYDKLYYCDLTMSGCVIGQF